MKADSVNMPSNIAPVWETLDPTMPMQGLR